MDDLPHPDWQLLCTDTLITINADEGKQRVESWPKVITLRLDQLRDAHNYDAEWQSLRDALNVLGTVKADLPPRKVLMFRAPKNVKWR